MKNQYLLDIGDFGKYDLLRFLAGKGINIGVNWYLTNDDGSTDGKFKDYLNNSRQDWMDEGLFKELQKLKEKKPQDVQLIKSAGLIPQAMYYSTILDFRKLPPRERSAVRDKWFTASLTALQEANLIFADPDNGISYRKKPTQKNNEKYILPPEVEAYYKHGMDVVFYCHKGRRKEDAWKKVRTDLKKASGMDKARIITLNYRKGTHRSYIFVIHQNRSAMYYNMLQEFVASGNRCNAFELESTVF